MKVVVVWIKYGLYCKDGFYIKFDENVVVLINNDKSLKGICIFGLIVCELCDDDYMKIILLVLEVL